ncbi:hypothetical protein FSP39_009254 [Pinctada imbricata]|uniref:Uncharacterized protein n=1 Tax=Pinctada imbricata TaxID=66713 RepID=A0AA88Y7U8_PINIB|nr:hypothetical protein FSP39_009254 [Pinctada imbricata]
MFIVFPSWFHRKYPLLSQNLKLNAQRLTTPFDIYNTLKYILRFNGDNLKNYGPRRSISLLSEVHFDRTCKNAGILPHWCTCSEFVSVSKSNTSVKQAASFLINSINSRLASVHNICEALSIDDIDSAFVITPSETLLRFDESKHDVINKKIVLGDRVDPVLDYQLSIRTRPGNGTFEATIRHNEEYDEYHVMGDISRTNIYGNQSHCINISLLKKYCFCKRNLP